MINIKRWIVFVGSTTDSSGAPWRDRRMGLWRGVEGRGGGLEENNKLYLSSGDRTHHSHSAYQHHLSHVQQTVKQ